MAEQIPTNGLKEIGEMLQGVGEHVDRLRDKLRRDGLVQSLKDGAGVVRDHPGETLLTLLGASLLVKTIIDAGTESKTSPTQSLPEDNTVVDGEVLKSENVEN